MADISAAPVKRILVESSGGMRVSTTAVDLTLAATEKFLRQVGRAAGTCAAEDGRKTIQDSDISAALVLVTHMG